MKLIKIRIEAVFSGNIEVAYRIQPKKIDDITGWDIWRSKKDNEGWDKLTRGRQILRAQSVDEIIQRLLVCNDYNFKRELISVEDII